MNKEKKISLNTVLQKFSLVREEFSSYDSYYACKLLLLVFYDKNSKTTGDFMEFVIDITLEHFEKEDLEVFKDFLKDFETVYKTLIRRLKDVSINQ